MPATAFDNQREAKRKWAADNNRSGRDIGEIPPVVNPLRRASCERNFRRYCETYHAETYHLGWSDDHLAVIKQIEDSVLSGGLFATAMPRGSGKSSLSETACEWAVNYGHRDYVALIGSDEGAATLMLESIKTEYEVNELLLEDFPEICYPITKLEGIAHR